MYRTLSNPFGALRLPSIFCNTPGEAGAGGDGAPAPAAGEAAGGEGEGSPPAEGAAAPSGETAAPGNLITGAQPASGEGESGEGGDANGDGAGDALVPLTAESITFPEGVEADPTAMEGFLGIMNNQDLDRAGLAQALVDLQIETSQQAADAATTAGANLWNETQTQWQEQARALPDIGGDNLESTLGTIRDGLKQMGATDATFEALNFTGAGNHPEIIKVLHALTKDLQEQPPVNGEAAGEGRKLSQAEILFGKQE